jgi:hypothetical protein
MTFEQAEVLFKRARLTRSLIELRAAVDGSPRKIEGGDAPDG